MKAEGMKDESHTAMMNAERKKMMLVIPVKTGIQANEANAEYRMNSGEGLNG
jgi:hypothetical protein